MSMSHNYITVLFHVSCRTYNNVECVYQLRVQEWIFTNYVVMEVECEQLIMKVTVSYIRCKWNDVRDGNAF